MAGALGVVSAAAWQRGMAVGTRCCLPLLGCSTGQTHMQGWLQNRSMVSKALREAGYKRPAPFPYKKKKYTFWRALLDDTTQRFDENTKIVVVDGPPTGNKDQFARKVAEELDMHYIPNAHLDNIYINEYGYDLRQLNDKMPASARSFDIADFLRNPKHKLTTRMQFQLMSIRFEQYMDAVDHLLNTGQGVVMNRSLYSDPVFMNTLVQTGFSNDNARKYYKLCMEQGMWEFLRPHLVIYLDIPVNQVIRNVKARGRPEEQGSPFYTPQVLQALEDNYKNYLRAISDHAEVLIYDWSEEGEAEVVVEDICRIDFEKYTKYDKKMRDWIFRDEWDWKEKRIMFSDYKHFMLNWLDVPKLDVPELIITGEEVLVYNNVMKRAPGGRYSFGFNSSMGDKVLFKLN